MDLISCVITTYKRPINTLKRAIESVINQSYKNIELIIVNDAPEEIKLQQEIKCLLNSYTQYNIRYIIHEKNMGACQARNTAVNIANGKYIAFLDDDDEWLSTKLEKQYRFMKMKNVDLVYCSHYEIEQNGRVKLIEEELAKEGYNNDDFERLLCENYIGSTSYPLIRLECVKDVGGFNINLKSSQDYELWLKITRKYKIAYLNEPLINYYITKGSISENVNNKIQGINYVLNEFINDYKSNKIIFNHNLNTIAYDFLKKRNYKMFYYYYIRAIKIKPLSINNFYIIRKMVRKIMNCNSKVN